MAIAETYAILEKLSASSSYVPLITIAIGAKPLDTIRWLLLCYCGLCCLTDLAGYFFLSDDISANHIYNIFTLIEGGVICAIYWSVFRSEKLKRIIVFIFVVLVAFALATFLRLGLTARADSIVSPAAAFCVSVCSSFFLVNFLLERNIDPAARETFFWINMAFFLYFSSSILLFMTSDLIRSFHSNTAYSIWGIHLLLNSITNLIIAFGVWKKRVF